MDGEELAVVEDLPQDLQDLKVGTVAQVDQDLLLSFGNICND